MCVHAGVCSHVDLRITHMRTRPLWTRASRCRENAVSCSPTVRRYQWLWPGLVSIAVVWHFSMAELRPSFPVHSPRSCNSSWPTCWPTGGACDAAAGTTLPLLACAAAATANSNTASAAVVSRGLPMPCCDSQYLFEGRLCNNCCAITAHWSSKKKQMQTGTSSEGTMVMGVSTVCQHALADSKAC